MYLQWKMSSKWQFWVTHRTGPALQFLPKMKFNDWTVCTLLFSSDQCFLQNIKTSVDEEFNILLLQTHVFILCKMRRSEENKRVPILVRQNFAKFQSHIHWVCTKRMRVLGMSQFAPPAGHIFFTPILNQL